MRGVIDRIHDKGAELVVIGNGAPFMGKVFVEEVGLTSPVYTDPSLVSYRLAGLKRGVLANLSPRVALNAVRAMRAGFRQTKTQGDALQQGGTLVLDKSGKILFQHTDREPGDLVSLPELLASLP